MVNKNIKLALAVLLFATAIWQFSERYWGNGIFLIIITAIVMLFYFRNEMIIMALFKLRKQDMEGASKQLAKIKNPYTYLIRKQWGYYYYLNGVINSQSNMNQSEKCFSKALEYGISAKEDQAMAKLQLSIIMVTKNRRQEAQKLISEAQKLDTKGMLKEQIKMVKDKMKSGMVPNGRMNVMGGIMYGRKNR